MSSRPSSSADLRLRILDAVRSEPVSARPAANRRRVLLLALGFAGTGAMALARRWLEPAGEGIRARSFWQTAVTASATGPHRPKEFVITIAVAWLLIAAFASWVGLARGRSMLGRPLGAKLGVALFTPFALVLSWLMVAHTQLASLDEPPSSVLHLHCVLISLAYAVCPLVAFFAIRRGTDPLSPRAGGAALGAVAGAWAALLYVASCDCTSPLHIALAHALPITLLAVAGALTGKRVLGLESGAN